MYYVKFDGAGLQAETKYSATNPGSGWYAVGATDEAVYGKFYRLVGTTPMAMTGEELAGLRVDLASAALYWAFKTKKTFLLQESYWAVQPDNGLTDAKRQEWINYRAALNAMPDSSALTATMPVRPSV